VELYEQIRRSTSTGRNDTAWPEVGRTPSRSAEGAGQRDAGRAEDSGPGTAEAGGGDSIHRWILESDRKAPESSGTRRTGFGPDCAASCPK